MELHLGQTRMFERKVVNDRTTVCLFILLRWYVVVLGVSESIKSISATCITIPLQI